MSKGFKQYKRIEIAELRPYIEDECMEGICIGSGIELRKGGMVARDPGNHEDQWYITKKYFDKNFEEVKDNV